MACATAPTSPGATAQDYTIAAVAQADNGARFRALVANDFGNVLSNEAMLTVIVEPGADRDDHAAGGRHAVQRAAWSINYAGTATDPEDGTLGGERVHVARRLPSRHPHASVPRVDDGCDQRVVHDPDAGRDVGERLVSDLR